MANPLKLWSRRRDLNPWPADYESAALPLSYAGSLKQAITLIIKEAWFVKQTPGGKSQHPSAGGYTSSERVLKLAGVHTGLKSQ